MTTKYLKDLRNKTIPIVIGGLVVAAITTFLVWFNNLIIDIRLWIWEVIVWIWTALVADYFVPGWVIVIGLVVLIVLISIYSINRLRNKSTYRKYTEDTIYKVKWRWLWDDDKIQNLICFCLTCDAELIYDVRIWDSQTHLICENCSQLLTTVVGSGSNYVEDSVKREIFRRIRTDEYLSHVDK